MKWLAPPPAPMTEEVKEILTRECPNGLLVVLDEEFPSDCYAAADLIGINCEDLAAELLDEECGAGVRLASEKAICDGGAGGQIASC